MYKGKFILKLAYYSVIVLHYFIVVCYLVSIVAVWFTLPWYLAGSISAANTKILLDRSPCPLTALENRLAHKIGALPIGGFVKDRIVRPLLRLKAIKLLRRGMR